MRALPFFLLTVPLLAACSRSGIPLGGGSGGASASSSSSMSASSTGGGGSDLCLPSDPSPPVGFDTSGVELTAEPQLVLTEQQPDYVTTLGVREVSDVINFAPAVREVSFESGDWNDDFLGTEVPVIFDAGLGYVLGPGDNGRYWAMAGLQLNNAGLPEALAVIDEAVSGIPFPPAVLQPYQSPRPLFVTHQGGVYGFKVQVGEVELLNLDGGGLDSPLFSAHACVLGRLNADAVQTKASTVIVANSSGRSYEECFNDDGIDGPPRFLQVMRMGGNSNNTQLTFEEEDSADVVQVHTAARSDGAWIVWQRDGGLTAGPLQALVVDQEGFTQTMPLTLFSDGEITSRVEVATLDDHLIVAVQTTLDVPPFSGFLLRAFDPSGAQVAEATYDPPVTTQLRPEFSLLAVPDGHLLLAFSLFGPAPNLNGNSATYVTRLSCPDG